MATSASHMRSCPDSPDPLTGNPKITTEESNIIAPPHGLCAPRSERSEMVDEVLVCEGPGVGETSAGVRTWSLRSGILWSASAEYEFKRITFVSSKLSESLLIEYERLNAVATLSP